MNNGYGLALNEWIFDERIKNELRLLIYISSLTAKNGYCFASNEHFAEKFKTSTITISRQISKLIKLNYIDVKYERYGQVVISRTITINKNDNGDYQKCKPAVNKNDNRAVNKNVKDNITSNNITSNNNIPAFERFLKYALNEKPKANKEQIRLKYKAWKENNWKDGNGKKIKNWKTKLLNTLRYIDEEKQQKQHKFL
jgi:hypothetical protein